MFTTIGIVIFAYFLGSINSAVLVCKAMGLASPYSKGSGNPGATNVMRIGGKVPAIITLVGDVLKGVIPVLLGHALGLNILTLGFVALAAVLGHMYPAFFKFKGGKGVATTVGALFAVFWGLGFLILIPWIILMLCFRYVSLASMVACILCPVFVFFLFYPAACIPFVVLALLIVYAHRKNIDRLIKGTENQFGGKGKNKKIK
jgi:glycerol-3-phosphate acyltransferase PlsY